MTLQALTHPVRVGLRSDNEIVRQGVRTLLCRQPGRAELVDLGRSRPTAIDVVLVDTFTGSAGLSRVIEQLHQLTASGFGPLVGLGAAPSPADWRRLQYAGARGFVPMHSDADTLVSRLEDLAAGPTPPRPVDVTIARSGGVEPEGLSAREAEVLDLVCRGLSNQEIADKLYLSINTVKTYIRAAYRKIGVTSRTRAVLWGTQHGL